MTWLPKSQLLNPRCNLEFLRSVSYVDMANTFAGSIDNMADNVSTGCVEGLKLCSYNFNRISLLDSALYFYT